MAIENLWGDDFAQEESTEIKDLLQKINNPKEIKVAKRSSKKSERLSLGDSLSFIYDKVREVLKKQLNNCLVIKDFNDYMQYIDKCISNGFAGIDTETNMSTDPTTCKIMGLCLYTDGVKQAYIPVNHTDLNNVRFDWQLNEEQIAVGLQKLVDAKITMELSNGKFDYQVIKCTCGVEITVDWDTQTCQNLLDENDLAGLKYLYTKFVDKSQSKYDIEELFDGIPYNFIDPEIFALYSATDPMMTHKVSNYQRKQIKAEGFEKLFNLYTTLELPLTIVTANMELAGVEVDLEYAKRLKVKYQKLIEGIDEEYLNELNNIRPQIEKWRMSDDAIHKERKKDKNGKVSYGKSKNEQLKEIPEITSPTQVAILLYDVLKAPVVSQEKPRATGEDEIKEIYDQTKMPICDIILRHRTINKLFTTYITAIPELAQIWDDHRVRTHFNQLGTVTGRYSSGGKIHYVDKQGERHVISGLNLQNIPSHNKELRMLFKGKDETHTIDFDGGYKVSKLDQVELSDDRWVKIKELKVGDNIKTSEGVDVITNITFDGNYYYLSTM